MNADASILTLADQALEFKLQGDGSASLIRLADGVRMDFGAVGLQEDGPIENGLCWHRGDRLIGEQYACRFRASALDSERARLVLVDEEGVERGGFTCRFRLVGGWLEVSLEAIDESLPSLCFPTPVTSRSLILPLGTGRWVRQPLPKFARRIYRFAGHGLRMRWIGGFLDEKTGHGWLSIFHRGHADAAVLHAGSRIAPVWLRSMGRWQGERVIRYGFAADGYVGMAKAFRRWTQENGLFVSLAEKCETRPHLSTLIGKRKLSFLFASPFHHSTYEHQWFDVPSTGMESPPEWQEAGSHLPPGMVVQKTDDVLINTTFRQAVEIIADARKLGWPGGLVQMPGWSHGGWDDVFPRTWPHEPGCGTLEDLEALWRLPGPFVVGILDNYADTYPRTPGFPAGVIKRPDGKLLRGGIWMGGQCYLSDYEQVLPVAKENCAHYLAHGLRGIYCDTTTAVQLYENWDPNHPMTRAQDEQRRVALLRHFRDQGLIIGSEVGCDFGIPIMDWSPSPKRTNDRESIPLWSLVFHDAHLQFSAALAVAPSDTRPCSEADLLQFRQGLLNLLACGNHLGHVRLTAANWHRHRPMIEAATDFDTWMACVGGQEMVRHAFLDTDGQVQLVEYANGAAMTINFSDQEFSHQGLRVPPAAFVRHG